jgi:hypothetical protein
VHLEHGKAQNRGRPAFGPEQAEVPHQWHVEVPTTNYNLGASFCVDMQDKQTCDGLELGRRSNLRPPQAEANACATRKGKGVTKA